MKIFLDDERPGPKGWLKVTTPGEMISWLKTNKVKEISLDHDLGNDLNIGTGYDVILWIEKEVVLNNFVPPKIKIHTANPSARIKMKLGKHSIEKRANLKL